MVNVLVRTLPLSNGNYGGILQAYALQKALHALEANVATDVSRADGAYALGRRRSVASVKSLLLRTPARKALGASRLGSWEREIVRLKSRKLLNDFVDERLSVEYVYDRKGNARESVLDSYDVVITGSDQVWRKPYGDVRSYMLDAFESRDIVRASYAASFGKDNIDEYDRQLKQDAGGLLASFDAISVRESAGVDLCEQEWGLEASRNVDPTMLLEPDDYLSLFRGDDSEYSRDYAFCYVLDKAPATTSVVDHVLGQAKLAGLEFMPEKPSSYSEFSRNASSYLYPEIGSWLEGIARSNLVVTDSFHGTVFAILFNRPFISVVNSTRGASRFVSLLEQFGLADRLVDPSGDLRDFRSMREIDWRSVNDTISEERSNGTHFLQSLLSMSDSGR